MHRTIAIVIGLLILLSLAPTTALASADLALGIPITPITPLADTVGGTTADVTDGVFGEAWWTYQGGSYNTCSFSIDLGATYSISSIVIGQYQLYGYELDSSTDGSTWTPRHKEDFVIVGNGGINNPMKTFSEGGTYVARYFRYTSYTNWNQYIGVNEFQVFGTPAAAPPTVPALSTWALAGLMLLMLGSGIWMLRTRRA